MEKTFRDILIEMRQREDAAWMKLMQAAIEAKTAAHAGEVEYKSWFQEKNNGMETNQNKT